MSRHNIMVRATVLGNARGRIDYISNPKRQEHLQAVYNSTGDDFWKALADHCREQAKYSQTKKAVEAREWMIPLANELAQIYDPAELARLASEKIKEKTGTENVVAVHWNKKKNNYHLHIISAENKEINRVKEGAVLRQNTYFDEQGKRSTKKKCVDQDGNLKPGCTFYRKGERKVEQIRFGPKIDEIGSKSFQQELKKDMADFQNALLQEDRFRVFDRSIHIAEQHIGKNTTPEQQEAIREKNWLVRAYNETVDECLRLAAMRGMYEKEKTLMQQKPRWDIKKHALTEDWLKAIEFHLKKLMDRAKQWREIIQRDSQAPLEAKEASEGKASLMEQIAAADAKRASRDAGEHQKNYREPDQGNAWDDR